MPKFFIGALLFLATAAAASDQPHLDRVEPFRLKVQPSGWVKLDVYGTFPAFTSGHPDLDQYEHWFVTRDGKPWQLCGRTSDSCRRTEWTSGMMSLELNAAQWLRAPGFIDIRMNEGLSADGHIDAPFSNAVRVPVLEVFGAPAQVVSVSKKEFVSGAPESDFVFRISANNFDERSVAVVFRGDEVVHPRRVYDGTTIEIAVPPKYRNMDGELSFQLRTDAGGYSDNSYVKVLKPKAPSPKVVAGVRRPLPAGSTTVSARDGAGRVHEDAVLATRVREAVVAKVGSDAAMAITVASDDGVVTLSGAAAPAVRSAAAAAAANVTGVRRVVNNLITK